LLIETTTTCEISSLETKAGAFRGRASAHVELR